MDLSKVHLLVVRKMEQMEETEVRTPMKLFDASLCEVMKSWLRMLTMKIK